jgi:Stage II sporulation protein E (SpoIIE)/CHASE domain
VTLFPFGWNGRRTVLYPSSAVLKHVRASTVDEGDRYRVGPKASGVPERDRMLQGERRAVTKAEDFYEEPGQGARWLIITILTAIAALGAAIAVVLWSHAERIADQTERESMARLASRLDSEVKLLNLGFGGGRLIAESGAINGNDIDEQAFSSFASQLVAATSMPVVAFEPVVSDSQRADFEARSGIAIVDPVSTGEFTRAPTRSSYLPVRSVYPATATNRRILGYDIGADPIRGAAARKALRTGDLEFSAPVTSQLDGSIAIVVIQALTVDGRAVATVSSAISARDLVDEKSLLLPHGTKIAVIDGDAPLFGSADVKGLTSEMNVGGRTWTLRVDHPDPDRTAVLSTLLAAFAATSFLGFLLVRVRRRDIELVAAARTVHQLSLLGERLAHCTSRDEVMIVAASGLAEPAGADVAAVLLIDGTIAIDSRPAVESKPTTETLDSAPLFNALNDAIARGSRETARSTGQREVHRDDGSTLRSITAFPLVNDKGGVIGSIAWAWSKPDHTAPQIRSTIEATRVLWQTGLARVAGIELQNRRTHALYTLGQALSVARTEEDIARAVIRYGPDASGFELAATAYLVNDDRTLCVHYGAADDASESPTCASGKAVDVAIELIELAVDPDRDALDQLRAGMPLTFNTGAELDASRQLRRIVGPSVQSLVLMPLRSSSTRLLGALAFASTTSAPSQPGNLPSITDLVAQTVERAQLFQQQTAVVLQLQERTLPPVGDLAGVEVKAHYAPAAHGVGIGGDWYDVEVLADDRLLLVVGDVVGHGITAVVDMVEISGMIAALARADSDLSTLPQRAFELLDDPAQPLSRMATAVVLKLDPIRRIAQYVRMGHPPPMMVDNNGQVTVLDGGSHPPIGVAPTEVAQAEISIAEAATMVLYTDGLIERRDEDLTVGIDRLGSALTVAQTMTPDEALQSIIAACGTDHAAFDDVALLLARVP